MIESNIKSQTENILKILLSLSGTKGYSKVELSENLGISERQIYRYIRAIENVGLEVHKDSNGYYRIPRNTQYRKELTELLKFSEEEAYILTSAIHSITDDHTMKGSLLNKLRAITDYEIAAEIVSNKMLSENIQRLMQAIKNKKQVKLLGYKSGNKGTITDRIVEPFEFTTAYIAIWCYEPESKMNKTFKIQRIERVEILESNWQNTKNHKANLIDVFRISGPYKIGIEMKMSIKAAGLLTEEYPKSECMISKLSENSYLFKGWVCSYDGIGRFVLGLSEDIEIVKPLKFKKWLNEKIKGKIF